MSKACIDCSRRHIGCHDNCKDYLKYKYEIEMAKKERQENFVYKDYVSNRLWKEKRT